jgi:leucyl/phenylalanyl-tRNA---protein transferase
VRPSTQAAQLVDGILEAYRMGLFPMADPRSGRLDWYAPDPRAVIPLEPGGFHISRSLARRLRSGRFVMRTDTAFERVITCCAEPRPERPETWIDERIIGAYTLLHRAGHAHCIEAWLQTTQGEQLVGGLYGVSIGTAFFAESMFCRPEIGDPPGGTDASKVCLAHLVSHVRARGYGLLDVQFRNPHIDQFGVVDVPRKEYMRRLRLAVDRPVDWLPFEPARPRW